MLPFAPLIPLASLRLLLSLPHLAVVRVIYLQSTFLPRLAASARSQSTLSMGNTEYIGGYGHLSLSQAVNYAQNSEGGVDQRLAQHLEKKLGEVYARLQAQPTSYILPPDEFALVNYYRSRFGDSELIKSATKRFWDNHRGSR
jgi:hypothetical protein